MCNLNHFTLRLIYLQNTSSSIVQNVFQWKTSLHKCHSFFFKKKIKQLLTIINNLELLTCFHNNQYLLSHNIILLGKYILVWQQLVQSSSVLNLCQVQSSSVLNLCPSKLNGSGKQQIEKKTLFVYFVYQSR